MVDYLKTIKQLDKMISFTELYRIDNMCWNYERVYDILKNKIDFSIDFLKENIG